MFAVIRAGGKQHKVAKGDVIQIEKVNGSSETVEFTPLLIVDDKGKTRSGRSDLTKARVLAKIVGETKGAKIEVHKYRSKTGYRRHNGHRQRYTTIQISDIKLSGGTAPKTDEEFTDGS